MKNSKKILILVIVVLAIPLNIIFFRQLDHFMIYYCNYKIIITMPKSKEIIYDSSGIDHTGFQIWHYNSSGIKKIIKKSYMKKITEENRDIAMQNYLDNVINSGFFNDANIDENFDTSKVISKGNYYAFIINKSEQSTYLLLFLDIETNRLYVFEST